MTNTSEFETDLFIPALTGWAFEWQYPTVIFGTAVACLIISLVCYVQGFEDITWQMPLGFAIFGGVLFFIGLIASSFIWSDEYDRQERELIVQLSEAGYGTVTEVNVSDLEHGDETEFSHIKNDTYFNCDMYATPEPSTFAVVCFPGGPND